MAKSTLNWQADAARIAFGMRKRSPEMAIRLKGAYLGQACSAAEILGVIFVRHLDRLQGDILVISPAHYCLALYAAMVEAGELPEAEFDAHGADGSKVEMIGGTGAPGMPFTTGSLAQGLSQAIGAALARRLKGKSGHIYDYLSDGELQEGQAWEAFMALGQFAPANITVIIDVNYSQVDGDPRRIMSFDPVLPKLQSFSLDARAVDGHELDAMDEAIASERTAKPRVIVARTNVWQGIPSLSARSNLHFVRFRDGEAAQARAEPGCAA